MIAHGPLRAKIIRAGRVAQVIECLCAKDEDLS
jgi:hypothetical protein